MPIPDDLRLNSQSLEFLEPLYADYLADPNQVPDDWKAFFEEIEGRDDGRDRGGSRFGPSFGPSGIFAGANGRANGSHGLNGANGAHAANGARATEAELSEKIRLQHAIESLARSYRGRGHLIAQLDPLEMPRPAVEELDPAFHGLSGSDMDREVSEKTVHGPGRKTVRAVIERLRNTYCRAVAVQYMHIDDLAVKEWLASRMESAENRISLSRGEQLRILTRLTDATIFEDFIQRKYIGTKSFSLEGSESLIPLLDLAIEKAGEQGIDEIVMAMAHRGRLNVLANIMGKSPRKIFQEFEDSNPELHINQGDVKYHLGHSNDWPTQSGRLVHLSLCFNPSHLEFVNPVALGRVRGKMERFAEAGADRCLGILIHGDAAFAGEGVVQETFNMSQLKGYRVGGSLHIVINNQIGFTTNPSEGRSNTYCTAIAQMLQIPIFHVNGENPEAVAAVIRLAMDFRKEFHRDVVINMFCYRRRGHNEGDEPSFTQPLLYKAIASRKSVREGYLDHLLNLGGVTRAQADEIASRRREALEAELSAARAEEVHPFCEAPSGAWAGFRGGDETNLSEVNTGVPIPRLNELSAKLVELPAGFTPHPKITRMLDLRAEMGRGEKPLDWATAESLAFASLATEGCPIRLSGQDCQRGTFSHRHSVLHDYVTGETHTPLRKLSPTQSPVDLLDSPLSETGVLGFDYGYSLDRPHGLTLWEAQFGDFSNCAQVIIDQFIASAEDKWRRLSGITLLLPHGFEGMGPEHSSARFERFLTLAAEQNMQIMNLTTPAQYFHCLRRQILRRWRKPLVIMTPKSLLRHPACVSPLSELAEGGFQRFIPDAGGRVGKVERVILCSGKIYYELEAKRAELKRENVAILRLEQLYPLPEAVLEKALSAYPKGTPVVWVQEEPENMGAWRYMRVKLGEKILGRYPLTGITRAESASPATGSNSAHKLEQAEILDAAFGKVLVAK